MAEPPKRSSISMGEWSGSNATDQLRAVIEKQHEQTAKQTTAMVWLTVVMLALTVVTAIATIVQAWLAFTTALPR